MGKLRLNNMQFYGYHGVGDFEKDNGGQFKADLELDFNMDQAIATDNISETIDYTQVYDIIKRLIESKKYNLLESLAGDILSEILDDFEVEAAKINLKKQYVPIEGVFDSVEVELEKSQEEM